MYTWFFEKLLRVKKKIIKSILSATEKGKKPPPAPALIFLGAKQWF